MISRHFALLVLSCAGILAACQGDETSEDCPSGSICISEPDGGTSPDVGPGGDEDGGGNTGSDGGMTDVDAGPPPPPPDPHPNTIPTDELFTCEGEPQSSPGRIRRIGRLEWTRAIGARPRDHAALNPLQPNPANLYSTWARDETLDTPTLDQFFAFLPMSADDWETAGGKDAEYRCMTNDDSPDRACVENWVAFYLERYVLYRPAVDGEKERLVEFALQTLRDAETDGRPRAQVIQKITSAAWLTTGALFRRELADDDGRLDDHDLARQIAYSISDSGPGGPIHRAGSRLDGDELGNVRAAAEDGTISDPAVIESLVEEYFGGIDPERLDVEKDDRWHSRRGEYWLNHKILGFFREWLGYTTIGTIFKDTPSATSAHEGEENVDLAYGQLLSGYYGYEPTLIEQMDDMIARIIVADQDVYRTLLTNRTFYVASNLSDSFKATQKLHYIYGVTEDIPDDRAARWVDLPSDERAGVLTHPAWLAAHGGNFDNDPSVVERGKWIRENLLCGFLPDVPITVDASFPPSTDHLPARERLAMTTGDDDYCQGCHTLMDPLGLPFEIYNHAGYLRAEDHGSPPDGSSELQFTGDPALDTTVADAVELSELFAESDYAKRCFIRQVFRYYTGRAETRADACVLTEMETAYDDSGGSFVAMLGALMSSEAFLARHRPEE